MKSKLSKAYESIEGYLDILESVRKGEILFFNELRRNGLSNHHLSQVHSYDDVEVQAFILAIPSLGNLGEMAVKSFLTYGAHFIDDFFDRPDLEPTHLAMAENRNDIRKLLDKIGNVGRLGHSMAQKTPNPDGVYKGIQRMVYGGLIQLSKSEEQQRKYLEEHKQIGLNGVKDDVRKELELVRAVPYWMTTKTVQEMFINAFEGKKEDFTLSEIWSVAYAPALFLHDFKEEEKQGEFRFIEQERPSIPEMIKMIDIASKHIKDYENGRAPKRIVQLRFLMKAFENVIPQDVCEAYNRFEHEVALS